LTSEQQTLSEIKESSENYSTPYILRRQGVERPVSWEILPLGDLFELEYGKSLPKKEREDGPYPVYGSNGRSGWHSDYHIEAPGIIVGRKGVNLGIEWSNDNCSVIDTAYFINRSCLNTRDLDLRYLYYNLLDFDLDRLKSGSAVPGLNRDDFYEETIAVPPLKEQKQIVGVLDAIDSKIEVNNRINEIFEEMAQALFKSWFVDFERYDEFKQSNIGEIPTKFDVSTFGEVSENHDSDRDPVSKTKRNEIDGDIPYYGATKILDYMDDYLFDGKFLLIAEDGSVKTEDGYPVIQFINKKFWASNHVHVVQGKGKVSTEFLRWAVSFVKIKPYITGSVQPKLNQTNLNSIDLAVPPEEDLEEFTDLVKPLHNRIWQNKRENGYLEDLRDTLLPKLMSGEIRVNDIQLDELEVDSEV
jgi:type I restriction enzyme S subunit